MRRVAGIDLGGDLADGGRVPPVVPARAGLLDRLACRRVPAVAVDDEEAPEALAAQRVERLGQHRDERLRPQRHRARERGEARRDPERHRGRTSTPSGSAASTESAREDRVGGEREVGVLLGRADREHDPVVVAEVLLDLHPVQVGEPHATAAGCASSGRRPSSPPPAPRAAPPAGSRAGRGRARRDRRGSRAGACRGGARRRSARPARPSRRERLLDVTRWSGRQWRRTPATIPAHGSSSSIGASEPLTRRVRVEQVAERVGAVEPVGPEAVRELLVGRRVGELHRRRHPELGEARHVLRAQALRVLDAVAQPERLPRVARLLERVERVPVRAVADRVHGDRPAGVRGAADDVRELLARRDLDARAVEHQRRLRAERAVHEHLQVAEAQAVARRGPERSRARRARSSSRAGPTARPGGAARSSRSSSCQSRGIAGIQPSLSWIAVTPRDEATSSPSRSASRYSASE